MTRERYSLTVRLRGRIFISSIVYFSWTAARGWRMIFPLSLFLSRSPLVYSSPRRAANTGRLMTLRGPPFAGIRVSARRWVVLGGATITSPLHSIPIDSSVTNCIMASSRKDTRGGGGGKESNREMMFANRLTTAQRRFMLLGRFANREIGK